MTDISKTFQEFDIRYRMLAEYGELSVDAETDEALVVYPLSLIERILGLPSGELLARLGG